MSSFVALKLTPQEVRRHLETVQRAIATVQQGDWTPEAVERREGLLALRDLLERGLDDEEPSPMVDCWGRPKLTLDEMRPADRRRELGLSRGLLGTSVEVER
jgi:hypothetical protein